MNKKRKKNERRKDCIVAGFLWKWNLNENKPVV